jgi:hypothetical protein
VISRVVELERLGRWTQALAVLDAYLDEPWPSDPDTVSYAKINQWFCRQQIGKDSDALEREIREWGPGKLDEQDRFTFDVGRAALLRDYQELARLLRTGSGSESLTLRKKNFRGMPLLQRAMSESPPIATLLQGADRQTIRTASSPQKRGRSRKTRR